MPPCAARTTVSRSLRGDSTAVVPSVRAHSASRSQREQHEAERGPQRDPAAGGELLVQPVDELPERRCEQPRQRDGFGSVHSAQGGVKGAGG